MSFASFSGLTIGSTLVALGVASAGWFVGEGVLKGRQAERVISVKGLSERAVKADLAFWPIRYVVVGNELGKVRAELQAATDGVARFLKAQGFAEADFRVEELQVQDLLAQAYRQGRPDNRFILTQTTLVRSGDVERVAKAVRLSGELINSGVVLTGEGTQGQPSYVFTKVADLKPDMLKEATQRAREAADEFARNAEVRVGRLRSASQGVIEILPAVELENLREPQQIDKKVRVVATITYTIAD